MRYERILSVRGLDFGKPRHERGTEVFRRFVGSASRNRGTKEAQKSSIGSWVRLRKTKVRRRHGRVPSIRGFGFMKPRHGRVPSVRGLSFGKPRHEGGTELFRRFVGSASGNRGTKEAQKGSVDSWVRLRKTEARMRYERIPSVRGLDFGKPRHERGTEVFRRFVGSASRNRGTKEAQKGSVGSWVRLRKTEVRRRHGRVPSIRGFGFGKPRHGRVPSVHGLGFGKPRHEGGTEPFRRFVGSASGNRGTKEAQKGSVDSWVRLRETEARMRYGRVPSIHGFGLRKPRHE
ncbi:hypothetical protein RHMOL_Rhmol06G0130800 [Rhododendron molle]|uniref:Uncharacterized protein n=1 Tax=Rhododendron molle TaxID=49168 RepID=A0ACC0NBN3_RHOML|nr:hypothetical protein RHMOL_Rhmol06G0130800 [Rhododendron molle]